MGGVKRVSLFSGSFGFALTTTVTFWTLILDVTLVRCERLFVV